MYLLPVWLGDHGGVEQLPPENVVLAQRIILFFCEHEKTARRMLRRMVPDLDLSALELHRLDKDTSDAEAASMLALMKDGRDAAIISEAGMPGIADPGAALVRAAHVQGVRVVPLIGPSSLTLALAASGLNGQRFTFHGYLPIKPGERRAAIKRLESEAVRTGAAQLFIETPYRKVVGGRVTDEVHYLSADEEDLYVKAQANAALDKEGRLTGDLVSAREKGESILVSAERVQ